MEVLLAGRSSAQDPSAHLVPARGGQSNLIRPGKGRQLSPLTLVTVTTSADEFLISANRSCRDATAFRSSAMGKERRRSSVGIWVVLDAIFL
uniref:Uncharacterized protein n=1 Tax=Steinernema glaseri TaxID=37863 RepID=A0A1I7ZBW1_9BILA